MAEIQKTSTEAGEMTQRFIEFVMMHAQQAAFALGQFPHPQTGESEVNLEIARLFIDQLVMIRTKTNGNLNDDESKVLNNAIGQLQMVFVEVSNHAGESGSAEELSEETAEPAAPAAEQAGAETATPETSVETGDDEGRKRFTKSYGS